MGGMMSSMMSSRSGKSELGQLIGSADQADNDFWIVSGAADCVGERICGRAVRARRAADERNGYDRRQSKE